MAGVNQRIVRQLGNLPGKGCVQLLGMPTVMAVSGAGIEQGVATE